MPNTYLTGTSFGGVTAADVEAVLTELRDFALAAGWTVHAGSPSSLPMTLRTGKSVGGIFGFYRFESPSAGTIDVRTDIDGAGTTLSAVTINQWASIGSATRVWGAALNDESIVFYVKPSSADGKAIAMGWTESSLASTDSYSWGLFNLDTVFTTAGSANKRVARLFNTTTNFSTCNGTAATLSVFVSQNLYTGSATVFNSAPAGSKPILVPIPIVDSGSNYRGKIPFAVNGLCGAAAGSISISDTGIRYLCTGAGNHGFQISDPS